MSFWDKILNRLQPEYFAVEKDYLLLHEILTTLRNIGTNITAMGSGESGMIPLNEFQIETAHLHFGTLVGFLNNPEDFKKPEGTILNHWQNYRANKDEIKETKYTLTEVSQAIDVLAARDEVAKTIITPFSESLNKTIRLTKNGLASANTNKYRKQYQDERDKKVAYRSTISTNYWMRWFTGVMAFAAFVTLIVQLFTCNKKTILELPLGKELQGCKRCLADSIYIEALRVVYSTDMQQKPIFELRGDTAQVTLPAPPLPKGYTIEVGAKK